MSNIPNDAPAPRLCIIVKWPDFEGYGFNLHAEKSKPGQYIGKVDEKSPAEIAGLKEDDRIIEVNGVNIANENHKQVVQRIKAVSNETRLLVVDPPADKYYKAKNIVVRGSQENVVVRSSARDQKAPPTPEPQTQVASAVSNGHHEEVDNRSVSSAASSSAASETSTQPQHAAVLAEADKDSTVEEIASHETMENQKSRSPSPPPAEEAEKSSVEIITPSEDGASLSGSEKLSEDEINVPVEESLPEASETDAPLGEEPLEERENILPEADTPEEEEAQQQAEEEEEEEEKEKEKEKEEEEEEEEEKEKTEASPPTPEQESDLEAEYDNVEIDAGRVEVAASQATSDSRRLSASSGESHSSHGSNTARTDPPPTQSPMSTSPTPPLSLESAPEPVRSSPPTYTNAKTTTTTTAAAATTAATTTNNASLKSPPVSNNNNYNSSGLNLNMSAAEMRAMLARKKKADPRKDTVDLKTKYQIIQNM